MKLGGNSSYRPPGPFQTHDFEIKPRENQNLQVNFLELTRKILTGIIFYRNYPRQASHGDQRRVQLACCQPLPMEPTVRSCRTRAPLATVDSLEIHPTSGYWKVTGRIGFKILISNFWPPGEGFQGCRPQIRLQHAKISMLTSFEVIWLALTRFPKFRPIAFQYPVEDIAVSRREEFTRNYI